MKRISAMRQINCKHCNNDELDYLRLCANWPHLFIAYTVQYASLISLFLLLFVFVVCFYWKLLNF